MYEKMRTKPLFGRGKLQKMLLVTRIGLLCILAFNITAAANVFSQAFNLKMKNVTLEEVLLEIQKKSSANKNIGRLFFWISSATANKSVILRIFL